MPALADAPLPECFLTASPTAPRFGPVWLETARLPSFAPLATDVRTDVCVIGAGISGLATAYFLSRAGIRVLVLDDGPVAGGMTGHSTAHLTTALDDGYVEVERLHGPEGARLAAQCHAEAIETVARIVAEERIDCELERIDGYLLLEPAADRSTLQLELDASARAGIVDAHWVREAPEPLGGPALRFPNQAQLHPVKFLAGLAAALHRAGVVIHTGTHVRAIHDGRPARVDAGGHVVTADTVVVATHAPIDDHFVVEAKQAPFMTYVVAAAIPKGTVKWALYCDSAEPYHYVRVAAGVRPDEEWLIVGGEDHRTGQADDGPARLERVAAWARARFPGMGPVAHAWAGQIMEPVDALGFVGPIPGRADNVLAVTGDSGNGITHAMIAARVLTDRLTGRAHPAAELYDPSRVPTHAVGRLARDAWNTATGYVDRLTEGDVDSTDEIQRGTGRVVRDGLRKLAVYRAEDGVLHSCSAVCPHRGCVVSWNAVARTWDCPCHGSRFDRFGTVVAGPAVRDLDPAEDQP